MHIYTESQAATTKKRGIMARKKGQEIHVNEAQEDMIRAARIRHLIPYSQYHHNQAVDDEEKEQFMNRASTSSKPRWSLGNIRTHSGDMKSQGLQVPIYNVTYFSAYNRFSGSGPTWHFIWLDRASIQFDYDRAFGIDHDVK